uniref:WGS project CBMG000000000 data, contig CS5907-c003759 n=1 Tax=Fusarium acuminatum CS5907 TaxID=1318461 RepID=A0A090N565_9HYPO|nr:unnamed protein product [Fusarium acuminatum CS5907]
MAKFIEAEDVNRVFNKGFSQQGVASRFNDATDSARVRQYFQCRRYGYIGTQCKATTTCGCCTQEHAIRETRETRHDAYRRNSAL